MKKRESYKRKVHYYETDQMGIVHHSNYIRWFEEARIDLMNQIGLTYKTMEEKGIISPVLEIDCKYLNMMYFDDVATNSILDYINNGGNILWLNAAIAEEQDFPNVNKILATYGVKPFEVGIIRETDTSKMVSESPDLIMPEIQYSDITKDIYNTTGVIFVNATKINIDTDKLTELNVEENDLLLASEGSYFRTNFNNQSNAAADDEETGTFVVGTEMTKTIKEANEETGESEVTSKLVIYGENYFTSDYQLSQNSQYGAIQLAYNKDLVLNSIAYLVDREEDITARKDTGTVTYTATEQQDTIIRAIIFTVPAVIIIVGIIVWQVRRRKK